MQPHREHDEIPETKQSRMPLLIGVGVALLLLVVMILLHATHVIHGHF